MAFAHERAGDRGLMGERLALAVEASNRGAGGIAALCQLPDAGEPPRSGRGRRRRRAAPRAGKSRAPRHARPHPSRPARLGPAPGQVAGSCATRGSGGGGHGDEPRRRPSRTARASRRRRWRCSRRSPAAGAGGDQAMADLVRARVAAGEPAGARSYLDGVLASDRGSLPARYLVAGLDAIAGRPAEAEARLPGGDRTTHRPCPSRTARSSACSPAQGQLAEAAAATLDSRHRRRRRTMARLLFLRAGLREFGGDLAGAIADYETLYARSSDAQVVANNLASLLTRAERRDAGVPSSAPSPSPGGLRGSDVPQFQDTYRLDPLPARRRRRGADLPRAGGRGAAWQRPGPVSPRRGRARPRQPRRGRGGLCRRPRRRRGRQPPAPGQDRPRPARELAGGPGGSPLGWLKAEG